MITIKESAAGVRKGDKFWSWTVLGCPFHASETNKYSVVAMCDCGDVHVVVCNNIQRGLSKRCVACADKFNRMGLLRHGESRCKLHRVWKAMKKRCLPTSIRYKNYGPRGIRVCEEWDKSYEAFRDWAVGAGYSPELEIDRINVNGNYCPENCRWVTCKVNCRNKTNNRLVEAYGEIKCLAEWEEDSRCVVSARALKDRLRLGWSPEKAMQTPIMLTGKARRAS